MALSIEWHGLLGLITQKTGRTKTMEAQMAIYQRAITVGVPKSEMPEKPFEEG